MQICVLTSQQAAALKKFNTLRSAPPPSRATYSQGPATPAQRAHALQLDAAHRQELLALQAQFDCSSSSAARHTHVRRREAEILLAAHPHFVFRLDPRRLRVPSSDIYRLLRAGEYPVCVLSNADLPDFNLGTLDCSRHKHISHTESRTMCASAANPAQCESADTPYGAPIAQRLDARHILMSAAYAWRPANQVTTLFTRRFIDPDSGEERRERITGPGQPTLQLVAL